MVVEICSRLQDGGAEVLARFVLDDDAERVTFEAVAENAADAFLPRVKDGIAGATGVVTMEDGKPFMDALQHEFHGMYLWATKPRRLS